MEEISTIVNQIDFVYVFQNVAAIYIVFAIFGTWLNRLADKHLNDVDCESELKKTITVLISVINGMLYYHFKNVDMTVIITSAMFSCICYDYLVKYIVVLFTSKFDK